MRFLRLLTLCAAALLSPQVLAREVEQQVKAAYLYRIAGYVEWPPAAFASAQTPVTFAVLGDEGVASELSQNVSGRTLGERGMTVRRLKPGESLVGIHVLFIGRAEQARTRQLALVAQPQAVLTVSESEGALDQGSVINFITADRRVRFEVSLEAAEKSRLKLSSRLLAVASQVRQP